MQLRRAPPPDRLSFDKLIETNILFLGGIGSGKTNAMKHLVRQFREKNGPEELLELFEGSEAHAGTARYLEGGETQVQSILAFLQPTLRKAFSGVFRERGGFSVRDFVRRRGGRALFFIEYDISVGSGLLPVYRVLMDLAMKAPACARRRRH
jgi:hypothetical protein